MVVDRPRRPPRPGRTGRRRRSGSPLRSSLAPASIMLIRPRRAARDPGQAHVLVVEARLPVGRPVGAADLHGRHLVFRAVGGPVRIVGGDHVGARLGVVEGGVDDARLHALGDSAASAMSPERLSSDTRSPSTMPRCSASKRVDLEHVLLVPARVLGAPRLRADVVLGQDAAGGEHQREARPGPLLGRHELGEHELAEAAHEAVDVHHRRAVGRRVVAGPLDRAEPSSLP